MKRIGFIDRLAEPSRATITGYKGRIAAMTNDVKDRHIAAAHVRADIITFNLRHFRDVDLAPFGIRAMHPDDFPLALYTGDADALVASLRSNAARRQSPPITVADYLDALARTAPRSAAAVHAYLAASEESESLLPHPVQETARRSIALKRGPSVARATVRFGGLPSTP